MAKIQITTREHRELEQRVGRKISLRELNQKKRIPENHIVTILLKEF